MPEGLGQKRECVIGHVALNYWPLRQTYKLVVWGGGLEVGHPGDYLVEWPCGLQQIWPTLDFEETFILSRVFSGN
jgi:hypothetical protein